MSTSSTLPVITAVDGSDDSTRALDWAIAEAERRDAPLTVVHVRQYVPWTQPDVLIAEVEPAEDLVLTSVREALAARSGPPAPTYRSLEGSPATVLPELGSEAQLLVLGSRGRGGFASLLLGSNGLAAARDAECPVVVVPRPGREVRDARPEAPGPRVVVGMSADAPDENTLGFAFESAQRFGARLQVISAYPWPTYTWTAAGAYTPSLEDQRAAERETAALVGSVVAPFQQRHPQVRAEVEVASGDAAGQLVAASPGAELVVVGRHRRRLLHPARMMGSVAHAVLLHAAAPVAVVPPALRDDSPESG